MVDLRETLRESPALAETARARLRESGAQSEAERLVWAFQRDAHSYSAGEFCKLSRWAALLAHQAYLHTAVTQMVIDQTSDLVRKRPSERALRERWNLIHALSHSTLLAASANPTTWLVEMAGAFEWQTWTRSFPLVRERVHRLAMRGAWAAARFGTGVVDRYLRVIMEGRQPLHCFDAVLGTTAIALASPGDSSAIIRRRARAALADCQCDGCQRPPYRRGVPADLRLEPQTRAEGSSRHQSPRTQRGRGATSSFDVASRFPRPC